MTPDLATMAMMPVFALLFLLGMIWALSKK
jgi:hypothetical protein